jgi:uncharacterized protein YijF (DUF1287 family)
MRKILLLIPFLFLGFISRPGSDFFEKLVEKAIEQTKQQVKYVPAYVTIPYPNGDVPSNTGVCTDLVIRAYRGVGIDLQKEVHEDMVKNFSKYPKLWGLKKPDTNIDHRRVPNLMTFFEGKGAKLKVTEKREDYKPGDIITWNLQNRNVVSGITHIGIMTNLKNPSTGNYMVAHNIGGGNELEDMLFSYTIIGHYRYKKVN